MTWGLEDFWCAGGIFAFFGERMKCFNGHFCRVLELFVVGLQSLCGSPEEVLGVFEADEGCFDERDAGSLEFPEEGVGLDELPVGLLVTLEGWRCFDEHTNNNW